MSVQVPLLSSFFKANFVSIHPMCRFKHTIPPAIPIVCVVSIHPMCRFKPPTPIATPLKIASFNTSYVSVQDKSTVSICLANNVSIHPMCRFKGKSIFFIIKKLRVSIHPMCRFKFFIIIFKPSLSMFQYILCVGSSKVDEKYYLSKSSFNTSYVSVQASEEIAKIMQNASFNTSYVSVQECKKLSEISKAD